jgi:hypothetical protein
MKTQERQILLSKFLAEQGDHREIYTIPSTEIDNILYKFLVGVRQKHGKKYEPFYLRVCCQVFRDI